VGREPVQAAFGHKKLRRKVKTERYKKLAHRAGEKCVARDLLWDGSGVIQLFETLEMKGMLVSGAEYIFDDSAEATKFWIRT
jgi:hypothetical protein